MAEKTIYICDKCGKEMPERNTYERKIVFFIRKVTKIQITRNCESAAFGRSQYTFDLCDECSKALNDWLMNEKEE